MPLCSGSRPLRGCGGKLTPLPRTGFTATRPNRSTWLTTTPPPPRPHAHSNTIPLPIAGVGSVVLAAEWRLGQPLHKPRLMVALGADAGAAVVRPGTIAWRKACFLTRTIGLEVRLRKGGGQGR